jgi:predicted nucleotidyltransferase
VQTVQELRYFDASPEARAGIVAQLRAALAERPEIRLAYLLGSFAQARPFRDIDIAVYLEPTFLQAVDPLRYCFHLADALERAVGYPVDVHRLNDAPCGFRFSATCGQVLLSRDEAFRWSGRRTWHEYADFEPYRRMYLREWLRPFRELYEQHAEATDANRRTAR